MGKKKLQTPTADQGKKQELSTRLQGLFKNAKGKEKQNRGNPNKSRGKAQCPEIIDVENYSNAVEDPNPIKIPASERESKTQNKLEREAGDMVKSFEYIRFDFGCDYNYPVGEFLGLEGEECFRSVFDRDYLPMEGGSGSYFGVRVAGIGEVEYSTDDMLKEFLKENLFDC